MKIIQRKHWKKILCTSLAAIVVISLAVWTILSPVYFRVQTESEISGSIFQFAKTTHLFNFSDSGGAYSFLFGMDYNRSVGSGIPTIVSVYASLVSQHLSSGFVKGVSLQVNGAAVLVDGIEDNGVKPRMTLGPNVLIYYLTFVRINQTSGAHTIWARLLVSTVDVNYIGYTTGSEQVVQLNGTISVA